MLIRMLLKSCDGMVLIQLPRLQPFIMAVGGVGVVQVSVLVERNKMAYRVVVIMILVILASPKVVVFTSIMALPDQAWLQATSLPTPPLNLALTQPKPS